MIRDCVGLSSPTPRFVVTVVICKFRGTPPVFLTVFGADARLRSWVLFTGRTGDPSGPLPEASSTMRRARRVSFSSDFCVQILTFLGRFCVCFCCLLYRWSNADLAACRNLSCRLQRRYLESAPCVWRRFLSGFSPVL